uniref:Reverse transcriptase domain-containing protein n=1 Tax=Fagus sylvatica TaxID=28930 RepID=A0A2N9GFJ3_FAGSY
MGRITMAVHTRPISLETEFLVVNVPSPYTTIMGRRWLHQLKAVPSSLHQKLCFPTDFRIMEIKGDQVASKQCIMAAIKQNLSRGKAEGENCGEMLQGFIAIRRQDDRPPIHAKAVQNKVKRLLQAGAIRELQYPTWLSNTVVVKKKNGKWRVCVDFTNLNQACPKDPFPLPKIDQLVDATPGHDRMSFLDAFQGYHQIALSTEDHEKTAFITPLGVYCYKVMPFGLKNAGATYQRMVTKMFKDQIGRTMEIYIDDMVVKSKLSQNHLEDLTETFRILRLHKLRLNASKCVFGVGSGKFLGSYQGRPIDANLSSKLLKIGTTFRWDDNCVAAFEDLKRYRPSALVYYTSKDYDGCGDALSPPGEGRLSFGHSGQETPSIFPSAHHLCGNAVLDTSHVSKSPILRAGFSKWGAKIDALDMNQAQQHSNKIRLKTRDDGEYMWMGLPMLKGQGTGVVIITPDDTVMEQSVRLNFKASNNEAEYEADLTELNSAKTLGAKNLIIHCDSLLIASQINGEYMARDEHMAAYLLKVQQDHHQFQYAPISNGLYQLKPWQLLALPCLHATFTLLRLDPCWMDPYILYLKEGILLEQRKEVEGIRRKASRFWLSKDLKLYRRVD